MKRGEIWTVAGGPEYAGKPRPAIVFQSDEFNDLASVTLCLFTTDISNLLPYRPLMKPDNDNGLRAASRLMVDKITTLPKSKVGTYIGRLADADMVRLNQAALVFLGLTGPARSDRPTPV